MSMSHKQAHDFLATVCVHVCVYLKHGLGLLLLGWTSVQPDFPDEVIGGAPDL